MTDLLNKINVLRREMLRLHINPEITVMLKSFEDGQKLVDEIRATAITLDQPSLLNSVLLEGKVGQTMTFMGMRFWWPTHIKLGG